MSGDRQSGSARLEEHRSNPAGGTVEARPKRFRLLPEPIEANDGTDTGRIIQYC